MEKYEELSTLENDIISCRRCDRLLKVTKFPMPHIYYGDPDKLQIFIIGRNPGREDNYSNIEYSEFMEIYKERWWECRIGRYLRERLKDAMKFVFFTNICKCSSFENSGLFDDEKESCRPFLFRQIEIIRPILIICLGADSRDILKPYVVNEKFNDIPVFNLYHPSYFRYLDINSKAKEQTEFLEKVKGVFDAYKSSS